MTTISDFWIYVLMCFGVAISFLHAAITGNLYSSGRGTRRLVAEAKFARGRVAFLAISLFMFSTAFWLIWRHLEPTK